MGKTFVDFIRSRKVSVIGGLFVAFIAILLIVGSVSYMFTWKQDQSLLDASAYFEDSMQIKNHGGSIGLGAGHFLVGTCFGIGALVLLGGVLAWSLRLISGKRIAWASYFAVIFLGTMITSVALSLIAFLFPSLALDMSFEGGIGGGVGAFLVESLNALTGEIGTILFIILLCCVAAYLIYDMTHAEEEIADASEEETDEETEAEETETEEDPFEDQFEDLDAGNESFEEPAVVVAEPSPVFVQNEDGEEPEEADQLNVTISGPEEELNTDIEEELPVLDIRSDVDRYKFPSLDLLNDYADKRFTMPEEEINRNIEKIRKTLASFQIPISNISASVGYTVTLYKITLGEGIRVNKVRSVEEDIAIRIGIKGVRVVILPDAVGIEVPNDKPSIVPLKAILNSDNFRNSRGELPIALGYTITTKAKVFDLADAPHLLVAGATKQGKSVGLNAIISSLIYSKHPTELKFVFIDPKQVEFQQYSKLYKHYLAVLPNAGSDEELAANSIVMDPKAAEAILRSLCIEMDERYALLRKANVSKITDYNEKYRNRHLLPTEGHHFLPYLVVVIDEYADLTRSGFDKNVSRSIENSIVRLAAKGRAAGLHVIIATQRPSVDVITGLIKSNFPTRMAFRTSSRQDSTTILGGPGAEKLIGRGDMLFMSNVESERLQCALISTEEIDAVTSAVAAQVGYKQCCSDPYYLPDPGDAEGGDGESAPMVDMKNLDSMFEEAARLAVMQQGLSTSMLQRKLQLGFARAGRIVDQLEAAGIVGPQQGSKPREALVSDLASLQNILDAYMKQ